MNIDFLLCGAAAIKKNPRGFQASCTLLAQSAEVSNAAKAQLEAAANAPAGKANTGLNESGWAALALLIGECSPRSTKLAGTGPCGKATSAEKSAKMEKWLRGGQRPAELIGTGNARTVLGATELVSEGLITQKLRGENAVDAQSNASLASAQRLEESRLKAEAEAEKARRWEEKKSRLRG